MTSRWDHCIVQADSKRQSAANRHFFERDWSEAWINFISQEHGPCLRISPNDLTDKDLSAHRFIYILSSLHGTIQKPQSDRLLRFVEKGGVLIVDGLVAKAFDWTGIQWPAKSKVMEKITGFGQSNIPEPLKQKLLAMPFVTRAWEASSSNAAPLLEMDGSPVLFRSQIGSGFVFVFAFDFGMLLTGLQQGMPAQGTKRLKKKFGTQARVIEPEDLVLKKDLLDNSVPWADLFEKTIWHILTDRVPAPRWWYFPHPFTGAVMSTHDEESLGEDERLAAMNAAEKNLSIRATFFIISDKKLPSRWKAGQNTLARWQAGEGPEIGLHWNRFKKPWLKIRSRKFGMHETPLAEQAQALSESIKTPVRINRTHYLALGSEYGEHFEKLARQGLFFDSTYGPNQGGRGYLFGTGYPYRGLDWNGGDTGVFELPFLTQELWGKADGAFLRQLIEESSKNYHECIIMNFHPHYSVQEETGRRVWLDTLLFAQEKKQWIPTLGNFFDFFSARIKSPLESSLKDGHLVIRGKADFQDAAIAVPYQGGAETGTISRVSLNGESCPYQKVQNGWIEEAVIAVPKDSFQLEVYYG